MYADRNTKYLVLCTYLFNSILSEWKREFVKYEDNMVDQLPKNPSVL